MLKKVAGAKDRLKQHLHNHAAPPPTTSSTRYGHTSRPRPHGTTHGSSSGGTRKQTAMSFSSVDNAAFEHILDDDTDFITVKNQTPAGGGGNLAAHVAPPWGGAAGASSSASGSQNSDLFDADMFDDQAFLVEESPTGTPSQTVNYDPLSGQIVSQPLSSSSDSSEGAGSGVENGNETVIEHPDELRMGTVPDIATNSEASKLDAIAKTLDSEEVQEYLFAERDELGSEVGDNPPDISVNNSVEPEQHGDMAGVSYPSRDVPVSSLPSTFEADTWQARDVTARHQFRGTEPDTGHGMEPDTDHVMELDTGHGIEPDTGHGMEPDASHGMEPGIDHGLEISSSSLSASLEVSQEPRSHGGSFTSDLEAELEMLLAPQAPPRLVGKPNVHRQQVVAQRGLSLDGDLGGGREGHRDSPHLDSGVYEHEGKDFDGTPERDGTGTTERDGTGTTERDGTGTTERDGTGTTERDGTGTTERDGTGTTERDGTGTTERDGTGTTVALKDEDELFPIRDDHFAGSVESSTRESDPRPRNAHLEKKNSSGKLPPPRPPMSPQVRKKMPKSTPNPSVSGHVTEDGDGGVAVRLVRPLGRTRVAENPSKMAAWKGVAERGGGIEQRVEPASDDNDELFPGDDKLLRELKHASPSGGQDNVVTSSVQHSGPISHPHATNTTTKEKTSAPEPVETSEFCLPISYHLALSLVLYLYYSLNVFPYLSGLFAGFLTLYMFLGSAFIYYVQAIEKEEEERQQERKGGVRVSQDFVQTMKVDFSKLKVYQSNLFTATTSYEASTHHPSQRMPAELKLEDDFRLTVLVKTQDHIPVLSEMADIRQCKVGIEPPEVAQNRKRRWSKKFPIVISCPTGARRFKVYLFSPTARGKEDWFRRLKSAASGLTSAQLMEKQRAFFGYMEKYFPPEMLRSLSLQPRTKARKMPHQHTGASNSASAQQRMANVRVQFSKSAENDETPSSSPSSSSYKDQEVGGVNITQRRLTDSPPHHHHRVRGHTDPPLSSLDEHGFEHVQYPTIPSQPMRKSSGFRAEHRPDQWLNALAARLCWDVWHEKRWKDWVMTRIEKKLIRIKTPSFMEKLRLTNIDVGNDMPTVNRLIGGPRLDLRGIWVYLDVTYQGKFVMTIETNMKLGAKKGGGARQQGTEVEGQQMKDITKGRDESGLPMHSPHSSHTSHRAGRLPRPLNHTQAAHSLAAGARCDSSAYPEEEEIDSGSDEEDGSGHHHHPLLDEDLGNTQELLLPGHASSETDSAPPSSSTQQNRGLLKSMVTRVAHRVVNTKLVRRAAEKVSNYPLVLTVEVNRLDGVLAVNIPPPPADTIWWGFHGSPKLELVAKPKVGHREVKLSKVTHWIERKLCDIVDKKLVLPEMEDLVVPILNSGMAEDILKPISSDSVPATPTTA